MQLSKKEDSLGICFMKGSYYEKNCKKGSFSKSVNFVNTKVEILGKHNVIASYTIGQGRGLA